MEFLQTNWVWILLALGAAWLLFGRGGMGCGTGGHGSHRARGSANTNEVDRPEGSHEGHGSERSTDQPVGAGAPRRHLGC